MNRDYVIRDPDGEPFNFVNAPEDDFAAQLTADQVAAGFTIELAAQGPLIQSPAMANLTT